MSEDKPRRRSKKERFLRYMMDRHRQWVLNSELTNLFGWSFNQRKNELQRESGIMFETKQGENEGEVYYRLLTDPWLIDVEKCKLRTPLNEHPMSLGEDIPTRRAQKPVEPDNGQLSFGLNF